LIKTAILIILLVLGLATISLQACQPHTVTKSTPSTAIVNHSASVPVLSAVTSIPDLVFSSSLPEIVRRAGDSVVTVITEGAEYSYFLAPSPSAGVGSGIIISRDGFILTNNHVITGFQKIRVVLHNGSIREARLQGKDAFNDLAVLKIDATDLAAIELGDSDKLQVGQTVVSIGNAFNLSGGSTVTQGIISALGRSIQVGDHPILHNVIQTDAAINPGSSGGPLVNLDGEVIGINTAAIISGENVGFAIASATAKLAIDQLIQHGKILTPWLGIDAITLTPVVASELGFNYEEGIMVERVFAGPAVKADLEYKDIITQIDNVPIVSVIGLQSEMNKRRSGDEIQIRFIRNGTSKTVKLVLEQTPENY
jgi:serine protease Do